LFITGLAMVFFQYLFWKWKLWSFCVMEPVHLFS